MFCKTHKRIKKRTNVFKLCKSTVELKINAAIKVIINFHLFSVNLFFCLLNLLIQNYWWICVTLRKNKQIQINLLDIVYGKT